MRRMCEQKSWVRGMEEGHSSSLDTPCCLGSTPRGPAPSPLCLQGAAKSDPLIKLIHDRLPIL